MKDYFEVINDIQTNYINLNFNYHYIEIGNHLGNGHNDNCIRFSFDEFLNNQDTFQKEHIIRVFGEDVYEEILLNIQNNLSF